MNFETFDEARCDYAEKVIVEGICLSFDLLREVCLETGQCCVALGRSSISEDGSELLQ